MIHELGLHGMKVSTKTKVENLRSILSVVRLKTGGQVGGRPEADADAYDSDVTDCSEFEGFAVYSKRNGSIQV